MPRLMSLFALMLAALCLAVPAQVGATVLVPGFQTSAVNMPPSEEETEEEEEEEEEEDGEEPPSDDPEERAEEEDEAGETEEATGPFPPDECLLRTARARLFDYSARDRVRLVIRYTSLAPAEVEVSYRLKNGVKLGTVERRFSKKGVFRLSRRLNPTQADKVSTAKGFAVQLSIPAAPSYCGRYYTRRLTTKRTVHNQVVWFQSDSIFGTG
jgi:hypothetical protein